MLLRRPFVAIFLSCYLSLFNHFAHASQLCPWQTWSGSDFFNLDVEFGREELLSAHQIREDLDCLRTLLTNVYSYDAIDSDHVILKRLENLSNSAQPSSNTDFVNQIFSLHLGFTDTHLSYQGGLNEKRFSGNQSPRVILSEELEEGKIIDRGQFVYFKTGDVPSPITQAQYDFIEFVRKNDRNLVIDLRGNGGGDDGFAHELAKALFTPHEQIPKTIKNQLLSPLAKIGYCLSLAVSYGSELGGGKEYCNQVRESASSLQFAQLLSHHDQVRVESLQGERSESYKSKVYIIIDPTCASSCETIVEKLSVHSRVMAVGQNTYGALHYSNPALFVLPRSKTLVKIPTLRQEYENNAGEGVGYRPKIQVTNINLESLRF